MLTTNWIKPVGL